MNLMSLYLILARRGQYILAISVPDPKHFEMDHDLEFDVGTLWIRILPFTRCHLQKNV
jgi:hypothetical protein